MHWQGIADASQGRVTELEEEFLVIPCYEVVLWQKTQHLNSPLGSNEPCGACHICVTRQAILQDRAEYKRE
jgi:hypothetical protein